MMQEKEVMQLLEETQAVLHGHFLLTSGLHSPMYVEKFNVLQHPKYTEMLCQELAERYAADNVELVIGPMTGGILLAHEVGKALGTRAIFTERENGKMTLKRGFQIPEGTRVCYYRRQRKRSFGCCKRTRRRTCWYRPFG